jgi:hypothetical protein
MVRFVVAAVASLLSALVVFAIADAHQVARLAPADEYFGRFHASILELRNRLNDLDRRSDNDMRRPGTVTAIDNVEDGIADWQRKYPEDTWLPTMMARLIHEYSRARATSDGFARFALRVMMREYPHAPQTRSAMFAMGYLNVPSKKKIAAIKR